MIWATAKCCNSCRASSEVNSRRCVDDGCARVVVIAEDGEVDWEEEDISAATELKAIDAWNYSRVGGEGRGRTRLSTALVPTLRLRLCGGSANPGIFGRKSD